MAHKHEGMYSTHSDEDPRTPAGSKRAWAEFYTTIASAAVSKLKEAGAWSTDDRDIERESMDESDMD